MPSPEFPEKLYYTIGEVKEITGIEAYVLRFWETEFSSLRPRKNKKGHRTYKKKDIELILKIKELLYENKFTIPGARAVLSGRKSPVLGQRPRSPKGEQPPSDDNESLSEIHLELTDLLSWLEREQGEGIFEE